MFKPTHFRFQNSIHWPGAGPTTEVFADNCAKVDDAGEHFTFVHAGGHAVKVPKAEVTTYGVYDADDVPNLPTEDDYKDGIDKEDDSGKEEDTGSADDDNSSDDTDATDDVSEEGSPVTFPGTIGDISGGEPYSDDQFADSLPADKKSKKKNKKDYK